MTNEEFNKSKLKFFKKLDNMSNEEFTEMLKRNGAGVIKPTEEIAREYNARCEDIGKSFINY